jgi:hypothetical protein
VQLLCVLAAQPELAGEAPAALRATGSALQELQQRAQAEPLALQGSWHLVRWAAGRSSSRPPQQTALPATRVELARRALAPELGWV